MHPVRNAKRAITPKPVRKLKRTAFTVAHPWEAVEGAAADAVLRRRARIRRTSKSSPRSGAGLIIGTLVVIGLIWVGAKAAWNAVFGPTVKRGPQSAVRGYLRSATGGEYAGISVARVWCRWNGNRVQVHLRVRNNTTHAVTITVSPHYVIKGHGSHGDSIEGYTDERIPARSYRSLLVDAGRPHGGDFGDIIGGQPAITQCSPDLVGTGGF
jgi:hypothetical protein